MREGSLFLIIVESDAVCSLGGGPFISCNSHKTRPSLKRRLLQLEHQQSDLLSQGRLCMMRGFCEMYIHNAGASCDGKICFGLGKEHPCGGLLGHIRRNRAISWHTARTRPLSSGLSGQRSSETSIRPMKNSFCGQTIWKLPAPGSG